jgi:hypothetical protein
MEEIEKRLRESTDACIKSFENWVKQGKNLEARETLMETMHEVRKVISRVEIEIAISERDRLGDRRLPIPPHRSSRKREGGEEGEFGGEDDFNTVADGPQPTQNDQPRRQQHGRPRRPMHGGGDRNRDRGPNNNPGNGGGDGQPQ